MLNVIAAVSDNGVIGNKGKIPWRIPEDMRHFRELTTGHTVIMGRKTWELLPHSLPRRTNIVVTTQDREFDDAMVAHSLDEAIEMADTDEVFIIGGGEIYKQAMDKADRLYISRVHITVEGDSRFPEIDKGRWVLCHAVPAPFDGNYEVYERVTARDRLIAAWREYVKENGIFVLQDSGRVSETEMSEYFVGRNIPVKKVSFAFEVYSEKNSAEVANLFKDMYRALTR